MQRAAAEVVALAAHSGTPRDAERDPTVTSQAAAQMRAWLELAVERNEREGMVAAFLAVAAILEVIFGVGEFAFGPSIVQEIAGLVAFGFGVLTIATVWGVREIHECWKKRWEAEDALAELTATPNRGSYIPE